MDGQIDGQTDRGTDTQWDIAAQHATKKRGVERGSTPLLLFLKNLGEHLTVDYELEILFLKTVLILSFHAVKAALCFFTPPAFLIWELQSERENWTAYSNCSKLINKSSSVEIIQLGTHNKNTFLRVFFFRFGKVL